MLDAPTISRGSHLEKEGKKNQIYIVNSLYLEFSWVLVDHRNIQNLNLF
jgi:hypothetical protein